LERALARNVTNAKEHHDRRRLARNFNVGNVMVEKQRMRWLNEFDETEVEVHVILQNCVILVKLQQPSQVHHHRGFNVPESNAEEQQQKSLERGSSVETARGKHGAFLSPSLERPISRSEVITPTATYPPKSIIQFVSVKEMNAIEVRGLTRSYGDFVAVSDLELNIETGECLSILGPNGAGKTTVVEILEGYRHRDAGEIRVLGVDPARATRPWRQKIGIVLQSASDLGELTVREAIQHFSRYYAHPRSVEETIDLVGLSEKANARASKLSGGQRRRLDVALGVIGRPELLFLDEPTTGFDPEARRVFWGLIRRLKQEGVTILLTTHYLDEADALADRVIVVTRGKKVADTTPAGLGSRSEHIVRVRWRENDVVQERQTTEPTSVVQELATRFGGEVPGLEVVRTTLEQAYLELVESNES
jgi:ABC-2 type transport system ATP-binding protein